MEPNKILLTVFLIWFSFYLSVAQVPGYLGKKNLIGYNCSISPVLVTSTLFNKDAYSYNGSKMNPATGMYFRHELIYDRVIQERSCLRFTLGSSFVGVEGEDAEIIYSAPFPIPIGLERHCKYTKLHTLEYKLGYVSYVDGFIAPVGFHYGYGIKVVNAFYQSIYSDNNNTKFTQTGGGVFLDVGKRRVYKDRFFTDVGFSFNFILPLYPPPEIETNNNSQLSPLTLNGIFNFKLGGGVLF